MKTTKFYWSWYNHAAQDDPSMTRHLTDLLGALLFAACIALPFALYFYWMTP